MPSLRSIALTQVIEWNEGKTRRVDDTLAVEEPLEIRVGRQSLGVMMRTPGHDAELAVGFLFTEGIIQRRDQLLSVNTNVLHNRKPGEGNTLRVKLGRGVKFNPEIARRKFSAGSACGVCGKSSIEEIRRRGIRRPDPGTLFSPDILCTLPEKLRAAQAIFGQTGGLHGAALFNAKGELLVSREDIGRHNAVDKVVGWALLAEQLPLSEHVLMVSGRGGFEIIQKSLAAGIPLLASVSAPSSLAVQLAREMGQTLIGFLRGRRFITYSGAERLGASPTV